MNEKLIQYIWRFQFFDLSQLQTTQGLSVSILQPGILNSDQGPDFSNARVQIGDTTWAGHIEIHIRTSDWKKHQHTGDPHYRNVILHVVWEHDLDTNDIPVLELNGRVPLRFLEKYRELMQVGRFIPCENSIQRVPARVWEKWKERLLIERLEHKSIPIKDHLSRNKFHWEETCWWLLAHNFGGKVNGDSFQAIAETLPLTMLARHLHLPHQVEALLMGQAGLLDRHFTEAYPRMLQKEYRFLRNKYGLKAIHEPPRFSRMRPGNFPTIRLAQLSVWLCRNEHFFAFFLECSDPMIVMDRFTVSASAYWYDHYRFEDETVPCQKNLGRSMIGNILINTICPLLYTYGSCKNDSRYQEKALQWLESLPAEQHRICRGFDLLGIHSRHAYDAQALTELHNAYCSRLQCLECMAGHALLKEPQDQAPQSTRILISG